MHSMRINSAGPEVSLKKFSKISGSFGKIPEELLLQSSDEENQLNRMSHVLDYR